MLDWTQSPYVALYFAVEKKPRGIEREQAKERGPAVEGQPYEKERCSAIWAIDLRWLDKKEKEALALGSAITMPDDQRPEFNT
jgi:hypothetical protein